MKTEESIFYPPKPAFSWTETQNAVLIATHLIYKSQGSDADARRKDLAQSIMAGITVRPPH